MKTIQLKRQWGSNNFKGYFYPEDNQNKYYRIEINKRNCYYVKINDYFKSSGRSLMYEEVETLEKAKEKVINYFLDIQLELSDLVDESSFPYGLNIRKKELGFKDKTFTHFNLKISKNYYHQNYICFNDIQIKLDDYFLADLRDFLNFYTNRVVCDHIAFFRNKTDIFCTFNNKTKLLCKADCETIRTFLSKTHLKPNLEKVY